MFFSSSMLLQKLKQKRESQEPTVAVEYRKQTGLSTPGNCYALWTFLHKCVLYCNCSWKDCYQHGWGITLCCSRGAEPESSVRTPVPSVWHAAGGLLWQMLFILPERKLISRIRENKSPAKLERKKNKQPPPWTVFLLKALGQTDD